MFLSDVSRMKKESKRAMRPPSPANQPGELSRLPSEPGSLVLPRAPPHFLLPVQGLAVAGPGAGCLPTVPPPGQGGLEGELSGVSSSRGCIHFQGSSLTAQTHPPQDPASRCPHTADEAFNTEVVLLAPSTQHPALWGRLALPFPSRSSWGHLTCLA